MEAELEAIAETTVCDGVWVVGVDMDSPTPQQYLPNAHFCAFVLAPTEPQWLAATRQP